METQDISPEQVRLLAWMNDTRALVHQIMEIRQGESINVDVILEVDRADLENRDDWLVDHN